MGCHILIGNVVLGKLECPAPLAPDLFALPHWCATVREKHHPLAPTWPDPAGRDNACNSLSLSHTALRRWVRRAGLSALFFHAVDGLVPSAEGHCVELRPRHLALVRAARRRWQKRHPRARPGWRRRENGALALLLWFEWWIDWALKNCPRPAIVSS